MYGLVKIFPVLAKQQQNIEDLSVSKGWNFKRRLNEQLTKFKLIQDF